MDLDPKSKVLNEIFGFYKNEPSRPCGLKNCHAGHNKGFLVRTEDGAETCIGRICGSKIFHEKFEVLSKIIENEVNFEIYKESVNLKRANVFEYWKKAAELTTGVNGILKLADLIEKIKDHLVVGRYAATELMRMAANRDTKVTSTQEVPKEKNEYDNPDSNEIEYKSVTAIIGQIQNIEVLSYDNNIRKIYEEDISGVITILESVDVDKISRRQLTNIGRRASLLDSRIAKAKQLQENAIKFLRKKILLHFTKKCIPWKL